MAGARSMAKAPTPAAARSPRWPTTPVVAGKNSCRRPARIVDVVHAVEEGAAYGWRRAHKHTDAPGEDAIVDQIVQGVLNEVCEYFDVDDEDRPA
jgi:hypothetical protein